VKIDEGGYWFRARYSGRCRVCDGPIAVGELLTRAWPSGYCHNVCPRPDGVISDTDASIAGMVESVWLRVSSVDRDRQLVKRLQGREVGGCDASS
jgi:hypothetical protein